MRNNLSNGVSIRDKHRGVVRLPAITWLQWDRGGDRRRLAVRVLRSDVRNKVGLKLTVALVNRRRVVGLAGITWLQWDRGGDRRRLAVRVLRSDVRNKVGDRKSVV